MFVAAPPGPPKRKCLCDAGAGGKKVGTRKAESVAGLCPSTSCWLPVPRGDAHEHPLPTRPLPTTETDMLGVGGSPQLLKWSVSVSAGLWSWTGLGLEHLGPRRRCTPGQSIRHSPLASPDNMRNLWHSAPGPFDCFILELVYIMQPCRTKFCVYIFKRKSVFKKTYVLNPLTLRIAFGR